jgi:hypothetical protein
MPVSTNFVFVYQKCAELTKLAVQVQAFVFLAKVSELLALQPTPPNFLTGVVMSVLIFCIFKTSIV